MRSVPRRPSLATLASFAVLAAAGCGSGDADGDAKGGAKGSQAAKPKPPPELPRGGRQILPKHRVVGFYGAPQAAELGELGIGPPSRMARKLERVAKGYRRLGKPVLPAMELIAVIAANAPGDDGKYRTRQPDAVIRKYLKAARKAKALLILDIQPGQEEFLPEVRQLTKWLKEPDVSLALDPEWRVRAPARPGQVIGSVSSREVNAVSFWLDRLTRKYRLPQKLLLVHRFTDDMITEQRRLKKRPNLALAINVDGFGGRQIKIQKYNAFARGDRRFFNGFKLFYREDTNLLKPRNINRLRPKPDIVVYE